MRRFDISTGVTEQEPLMLVINEGNKGRMIGMTPVEAQLLLGALESHLRKNQADHESALSRYGALVEAARDADRWLQSPKDGDPVGVFEDIAEWFREETGYLRPGKSYPMEAPCDLSDEELQKMFNDWCAEKRRGIRAALRAALQGMEVEGS